MIWALVSDSSIDLMMHTWNITESIDEFGDSIYHYEPVSNMVQKPAGTIVNLIVYVACNFTPPEGCYLVEALDSAKIGDEGY